MFDFKFSTCHRCSRCFSKKKIGINDIMVSVVDDYQSVFSCLYPHDGYTCMVHGVNIGIILYSFPHYKKKTSVSVDALLVCPQCRNHSSISQTSYPRNIATHMRQNPSRRSRYSQCVYACLERLYYTTKFQKGKKTKLGQVSALLRHPPRPE